MITRNFHLDEFKTFFRVSRQTVESLIGWIQQTCREDNIKGITTRVSSGGSPQKPLEHRVLVLLWFMASLDKYSSIADRFGMSESTACIAVHTLLGFVHENLLRKIIVWPSAPEQQEIKSIYSEVKQFPGVIGFIDGTHIQITQPSERGYDYYNRKDYYSVVLQGVVREDMRFTDVYAGWPGKVHDARVFRNSPLGQNGADICGDGHMLGDSAYPNLPYLLSPFRDNGHLTDTQKNFNRVHSSMRVTVERAFGLLKGRFVRLQNINQKNIEIIVQTILTACVLHNLCIINSDDLEEFLEDQELPQCMPNPQNYNENEQMAAAQKRLVIAHHLLQ